MLTALLLPNLLLLAQGPALKQIEAIHEGLPHTLFKKMADCLSLPAQTLAEALRINPKTLRNRQRQGGGRLNEEESEKFLRVARVYAKARQVLGSDERATAWISAKLESLGDKKPIDLLETDIGTQEVLNVLSAIEWGIYL